MHSNGLEVFSGQVTVLGELRLTATGRAVAGGRPVTFTMACLVTDEGLAAGIKADGSMAVLRPVPPGRESHPSSQGRVTIVCY